MLAILIYTASRAGAVASLKRGSFYRTAEPWMLRFEEKGGKSREIPVRHDLQEIIFAYLDGRRPPRCAQGCGVISERGPQREEALRGADSYE